MKKIYILFILILSIFQLSHAQSLENLWSNGFLSSTNKVRYNSADNSWIVAGVFFNNQSNATSYIEGDSYISKIDSLGNVIWETIYNHNFPIPSVSGLDILNNNNIILLSLSSDCDVNLPDSLIQYNTNGIEISKIESPISFPTSVKAINNNRFILTSTDKIALMDNALNVIWTYQLTNSSYNISIHQAPNGNIFAFTEDNVLNIDINTGLLYNNYPSNTKFVVAQEGSFFYMIDEVESVAIMDTSYNFGFAAFSVASHFDEVYKANVIANNKIVLYGKKDGYTNIKLFDSGFMLIDSLDWEIEYLFVNDFDFNHNQIAVVGSDLSAKYPASLSPIYPFFNINEGSAHSFIKTFDYNLNNSLAGVDVGVTQVNYNNLSTTFDSCGSSYYSHNFIVNDIAVTIKNHGTQTINSLKLFHRQTPNCPSFCPTANFYTFPIDTISLAPNASTTIHISQIEAPLQNASAPFDFCFWTGEANNQIDVNHSNDKNCQPLYSNTTIQQTIQHINIFPNPSSDRINLELPDEFQNIQFEIINNTGQIVKTGNTRSIDISNIVGGFYIVRGVNDEGDIFLGKFIKQ